MKTIQIGNTGPQASQVILGLMRIADKSDAEIRALVDAALEAGITMMDHADIYGRPPVHHCEARFAEAMQLTAAAREEMVIQTKAGIREGFFDFSKAHILAAWRGLSRPCAPITSTSCCCIARMLWSNPRRSRRPSTSCMRRKGPAFWGVQPDAGSDRAPEIGGPAAPDLQPDAAFHHSCAHHRSRCGCQYGGA